MATPADPGLQGWLIDRVLASYGHVERVDDAALRRLVAAALSGSAVGARMTLAEKQRLSDEVLHAMRGLGILQPLYEDPEVTEIMVNGPDAVFFERNGRLYRHPHAFGDRKRLADMIVGFFARADRSISESEPMADLRLPDGSRAHAAFPPVAPEGPVFTIRKFTGIRPDMEALVRTGFLGRDAADFLQDAVRARRNLFVSGGTGTGKTTLLNVLSASIPGEERVVTIEDSAELRLQGLPNLVRLEARLPLPDGSGAVGLPALVRASLRMRPDRIIVGEVRGPESHDMLQAMNTGHAGSLSTGHANSAADMLVRLATLALAPSGLPYEAVVRQVASAVHLVVHLVRLPDGRRAVREIVRVRGSDGERFDTEVLFERKGEGTLARTSTAL